MRLTPEQIEKQILEGKLTVSGGKDGNPPDKYDIVRIGGNNLAADLAALNASADLGFRIDDNQPPVFVAAGYILMTGYKENK